MQKEMLELKSSHYSSYQAAEVAGDRFDSVRAFFLEHAINMTVSPMSAAVVRAPRFPQHSDEAQGVSFDVEYSYVDAMNFVVSSAVDLSASSDRVVGNISFFESSDTSWVINATSEPSLTRSGQRLLRP